MRKDLFRYKINEIESNFCEVEALPKGEYDKQAVKYDKIISNGIYNRVVWGNAPKDYLDFCKTALKNSPKGAIADVGCGTLSFTHEAYKESRNQEIYLCDLSYEMLKLGKNRIENVLNQDSDITFLRSDALDMPFNDNTVQTVLCFGLFHLFDNPAELLKELTRISKPGAQIYFTILCTDRITSKILMHLLYKKGHLARPLPSGKIKAIIEENGIKIADFKVKGGMVYVSGVNNGC